MIDQSQIAISVLLPVYNAEKYIEQAIDSILNQSFKNFELLILNDGSTDHSEEIINSLRDERIKIINNTENLGLIKTLNNGLSVAKGKYIARMDADDIALPNRFQKQFDFLESNPEIGVLGTNIETFGDYNSTTKLPLSFEDIEISKYFINPIAHPTVFIRKAVLDEHKIFYRLELLHTEDWGFWMDLSKVTRLANLPDVTLKYRLEGQNITTKNHDSLRDRMFGFYKLYLAELFDEVTESLCLDHWNFVKSKYDPNAERDIQKQIGEYKKALLEKGNNQERIAHFFEQRLIELFYGIANVSTKDALLFAKQNKILDFKKRVYLMKKSLKK